LTAYINDIDNSNSERRDDDLNYQQTIILLSQCKDYIYKAYHNIPIKGISFKVHQQLMMVELILARLTIAIDMIVIKKDRTSQEALVQFIKYLVSFTSGKSQITDYINKSTQIYAREITRNIAIKGEQYITKSSKEYWQMFKAALGGGAIVAIACMVKLNLGSIEASLLTKAFYYSMNYSFAFIAIYLFHLTLATKQPAMTAATLAKNLREDEADSLGYETLAKLVSQVWRTQFIAFVGNVFMAFPVALLIIASWFYIFNENAAIQKAPVLIGDLNIFTSPAIFHAAIAGVFLFISGLIAGNISNRNKVKHIPERVINHPVLKQITTLEYRTKLASYIDYYWAGIVSNFWFGVFMGSVSTLGIIIGLDLDIRHITFAAGNFALGLYGYNFQLSGYDIFHSILGVGVIGFVNFSVSFALSLLLALRSRGVKIIELREVFLAIRKSFQKNPLSFFYPPKQDKL
jgi:site-specific recombinase